MHDILFRTAFAPVLVAQGLHAARTAPKLPEPPGPRAGQDGQGPHLRLLIAGDSSAAGVGAPHQQEALSGHLVAALAPHRTVSWRLIARTGATTRSATEMLEEAEPDRFDVAVTALGVNDITRGVPVDLWIARQKRLAQLLRDRFGVTRIVVSGLPPMETFPLLPQPLRWVLGEQARRFNRRLQRLAETEPAMTYARPEVPLSPEDMAEDGYHPRPVVYRVWGGTLAEAILRLTD